MKKIMIIASLAIFPMNLVWAASLDEVQQMKTMQMEAQQQETALFQATLDELNLARANQVSTPKPPANMLKLGELSLPGIVIEDIQLVENKR